MTRSFLPPPRRAPIALCRNVVLASSDGAAADTGAAAKTARRETAKAGGRGGQ
jgi:hypothetical protein